MVTALIFDFDGTLVDTMPLHYEAYRQVFAEMGLALTLQEFMSNIGGNARESIPKFLGGRESPWTVSQIHERKQAVVQQLFDRAPIPVLETAKLLVVTQKKFRVALASSGSRPGIMQILQRLDWQKYFEVIVTGEDVPNGKPAPDLFLAAAKQLKVDPGACLVFEDTDAGVEAAHRAGMDVFDVRRTVAQREIPAL